MKRKLQYFMTSVFLFASACATKTVVDEGRLRYTTKQLEIAQDLVKKNSKNLLIREALDFHDAYYKEVRGELGSVLAGISVDESKRKIAIKKLKEDANLMEEVQQYVLKLPNPDENESITRLGFNKAPITFRKAAELLEDDEYFNAIAAKKFPPNFKFSWDTLTFFSGVEDFDDKGTIAIAALAASLIYLSDQKDFSNYSAIIYQEKVTEVLKDNPKLLEKLRNNYYLFSKENDVISKVYEGYEFGGDKDLEVIGKPKFLPFDCATGIDYLLGIKKDQFYTYHLASYYNEYFQENSVYWGGFDWGVRENISKKLKPAKLKSLGEATPGMIVAWRSLKDGKESLIHPNGYVGSSGHIGIILGKDGDDLYYISWTRDLEESNRNGIGIDALSISRMDEWRANNKLAIFSFTAK